MFGKKKTTEPVPEPKPTESVQPKVDDPTTKETPPTSQDSLNEAFRKESAEYYENNYLGMIGNHPADRRDELLFAICNELRLLRKQLGK